MRSGEKSVAIACRKSLRQSNHIPYSHPKRYGIPDINTSMSGMFFIAEMICDKGDYA